MSNDKAFRTMGELIDALRTAEQELRDGALSLTTLDQASNDARELYERMVVIRHKAREKAKPKAAPVVAPVVHLKVQEVEKPKEPVRVLEVSKPAPVVVAAVQPERAAASEAKQEAAAAAPAAVPEPPIIRLDTKAAEPIRQTTLIEAIADTEKKEPVTAARTASEYLKQKGVAQPETGTHATPSLAEKLEKSRIADLSKAISVSHKFWFTAELFGGDRGAYETGISLINSANNLDEATSFFETEVVGKLARPADPSVLTTFSDLLQRRFA